jgi:hypothetical protein
MAGIGATQPFATGLAKVGNPPEPTSDAASDFTRYRRKNSKLSVVSIISRR